MNEKKETLLRVNGGGWRILIQFSRYNPTITGYIFSIWSQCEFVSLSFLYEF